LFRTTAYRHDTYTHLLLYLAYAIAAFVFTQALRRASQLRILAWILCSYGTVLASFALVQALAPNGKLYWIWLPEQGGYIYGPYVNHNHYAGLMEMLAPFPLVLAASRFTEGNRRLAALGVAALMAGTIVLSGSRGGAIALLVQIVVLAILLRHHLRTWKRPLLIAAILAAGLGVLVFIGGNELSRRMASIHSEAREELTGGTRLTIDRDAFRMMREKPLLGWGLGTFPVVYPRFRSFFTTFAVNDAHNDYLQFLVETGLAGSAIGIWFLVLTFRRARPKINNWTETANGTLTVAALIGCVGILIHSFVDFNLQIPANAAIFYVLCAIAACDPIQESSRRRVRRQSSTGLGDKDSAAEDRHVSGSLEANARS
jgi:O-antigen ligase